MKIICISDQHGLLPAVPKADVLVIAGDICPVHNHKVGFQRNWLNTKFLSWIDKLPVSKVFMTWGNHDWAGEHDYQSGIKWATPGKLTLLVDEAQTYHGLKFYGTPWQREFCNWAFNLTEAQLAEKYALIPDDADVVISHGPPYGTGDNELGSPSLTARLDAIQPALAVFGHIHCAAGIYHHGESLYANAAIVDEMYQYAQRPIAVTINSQHEASAVYVSHSESRL